MKLRLQRPGWKSVVAPAATAALLVAFTGLAFAKAGTSSGSHPSGSGADRRGHATKQGDKPDERSDADAGGGPPPGTHGYEVSKVARETPPGPGHGRAVSAVARGWAGKRHSKHANRGHRPRQSGDSDSDE
jgi:hypothetical protein